MEILFIIWNYHIVTALNQVSSAGGITAGITGRANGTQGIMRNPLRALRSIPLLDAFPIEQSILYRKEPLLRAAREDASKELLVHILRSP